MSLLSDLLAKVKPREENRDVPPTLKDDILRSLQQRRARRRWMLTTLVFLVMMAVGAGLVVWFGSSSSLQPLVTRLTTPALAPGHRVAGLPEPATSQRAQTQLPPSEQPSQGQAPTVVQLASVEPTSPTGLATAPGAVPGLTGSQVPSSASSSSPEGLPIQGPTPGGRSATADTASSRVNQAGADRASGSKETKTGPDDGFRQDGQVHGEGPRREGRPAFSAAKQEAVGQEKEIPDAKLEGPDSSKPMGAPVKTPRWDRDVYLYQASTSEAAGDLKQALGNYQKALATEPRNHVVLNNMASLSVRMGSYDEAIRYAERALAVKPQHVPALVNLSIAYLQNGNRSAGEDCLRRALAVEPTHRLALRNLAILLEKQNSVDEARSIYARLAQLGDAQGFLGMARLAEKQDKTVEAVRAYQGLLKLERVDPADRALASDRIYWLTQ
jgi:Tfp pilus assembly protein PilF